MLQSFQYRHSRHRRHSSRSPRASSSRARPVAAAPGASFDAQGRTRVLPLTTAAVAFVVALAATPAVRLAAMWTGLVDVPGPRSSHARATPRGGGLALVPALGAASSSSPPAPVARAPGGGGAAARGRGAGAARARRRPLLPRPPAGGWPVPGRGRRRVRGRRRRLAAPAAAAAARRRARPGGRGARGGVGRGGGELLQLPGRHRRARRARRARHRARRRPRGLGPRSAAVLGAAVAGACAGFLAFNWAPGAHLPGRFGQPGAGIHFRRPPAAGAARDSRPEAVFWW